MNFPQCLMKVEFIIGPAEVALNGVDFGLAVGRDFEVDLIEVDD